MSVFVFGYDSYEYNIYGITNDCNNDHDFIWILKYIAFHLSITSTTILIITIFNNNNNNNNNSGTGFYGPPLRIGTINELPYIQVIY